LGQKSPGEAASLAGGTPRAGALVARAGNG